MSKYIIAVVSTVFLIVIIPCAYIYKYKQKNISKKIPVCKDDILYKYMNNNGTKFIILHEIDKNIVDLRLRYQKMSLDKRIPIDLCDDKDKLGLNRESQKHSMGNNCEPWISRECIFVLDHILPYNAVGLEWSSGSSTVWLSYRLKSLISVENTKSWSEDVQKKISEKGLDKKTKLFCINNDDMKYCRNDKQYISNYYRKDKCFKTYVTTNLIPDIKYDFISVDGRARTGCLLRAIKMLKKENGIIIIDNAERDRYQWSYKQIPSNWSKHYYWYDLGLVLMFISHQ